MKQDKRAQKQIWINRQNGSLTMEEKKYNRGNTVFSPHGAENWISTHKKKNLDTNLMPFTKINSKWITELNVYL